MKTLFVMRHAKSDWENPNQSDFERPLNGRGKLAAPKIGELMKINKFAPDLIVSSPAVRAKTTAEKVKTAANFDAEIKFDARIYEAAVSDLLAVLAETPNAIERILIVGHNPGLENLVRNLTGEIRAMPTAALAEIELQINDWSAIRPDCGKLRNLFTPKEIAD